MARNPNFQLPPFRKLPSTQSKITNFFKYVPKDDILHENQNHRDSLPNSPIDRKKTHKTTENLVDSSSELSSDDESSAFNSKKRVIWSDEVKQLAVNRHLKLNGTLFNTIRDLKRTHPGSIFEALTVSVLHSWLPKSKKREATVGSGVSCVKKGRKTYLPEHLLEEFKIHIRDMIESRTRISIKCLLINLKAVAQNKGYGNYLAVIFFN